MRNRLALHTWTLDTTPLAEVLEIARGTGWNAVELRISAVYVLIVMLALIGLGLYLLLDWIDRKVVFWRPM